MSTLIVTKPLLAKLGQSKLAESLEVRAQGDYAVDDWVLGSSFRGDEMLVVAVHCQTQWAFLVGVFERRENPDLRKRFYARLWDSLQTWGVSEDEVRQIFGHEEDVTLRRTRDASLMGQASAAATECAFLSEALEQDRRRVAYAEFLTIFNQRKVKALRGAMPMDLFDAWLDDRCDFQSAPKETFVASPDDVPDLGRFQALFYKYADAQNGARSLAEVEGFICAVQASPGQMHPLQTLYGLLGTDDTNWESLEDVNSLLSEFARWSNYLVRALGGVSGSFSPMFAGESNRIDTAAAHQWCTGFAHGWLYKFSELPTDELADAVFLIVSQTAMEQPAETSDELTVGGRSLPHGPLGIGPAVEWLFKTSQKRADWI